MPPPQDGAGDDQVPASRSLTDMPAAAIRREPQAQNPNIPIQPAARNKAEAPAPAPAPAPFAPSTPTAPQPSRAPKPTPAHTHARETNRADTPHADSSSEVTSPSTGPRPTSASHNKPGAPPRRPKTQPASARWRRTRTSSDDTAGSDRQTSLSSSSRASSSQTSSLGTANASHHASSPSTTQPSPPTAPRPAAGHKGPLMATNFTGATGDSRRGVASPRPKGREAKNTFCRNVTIYGHCRYENTCPYIHDSAQLKQNENTKKRAGFNVDSPSFTPLQPSTNGIQTPASRGAAISPKAANAAVFTPKSQRSSASTPNINAKEPALDWHSQDFQEFVPQQSFDGQMVDPSATAYDPFNTSSISAIAGSGHQGSTMNPYVQDPTGASYYQSANTFQTSPAYHLYWPIGPQPTNLQAYQRTAHDFFITDTLREDLQKKSEVARQILPNSSLPAIEQYHSLVCLDTTQHKNQTLFGYASWVYKAVSGKDGNTYALRRLENYKLTNENAIRSVQPWKRILNGGVVTIHDAFTTRAFGDSSLILVTDYHPCSKPLSEEHFKPAPVQSRYHARQTASGHVPEQVLWGYIVQIASALKAIHGVGLAARLITPSKILLTSKNRVRLNACGIMDVVQYNDARTLSDIQADDLLQLGRLILCIANNNLTAHLNMQKSMDHLTRSYTGRLKECIQWLLNPLPAPGLATSPTVGGPIVKDIESFLSGIADQFAFVFDSTLHAEDNLVSTLGRELESSRLVRLLIKLNFINERPELDASLPVPSGSTSNPSSSWAETGERYYLKLFRDYVFHQVDANGHPSTNLAHVLDCLNKLDAGSEERVALISRDEQNVLIVSYRELKRGVESAFQDLVKAGRGSGR